MPFTPQVEPSHYRNLVYDSKERYISYWHQIQTVVSAEPSSVLEIGIGNGFVHRELRRHGMQVTTLDADAPNFLSTKARSTWSAVSRPWSISLGTSLPAPPQNLRVFPADGCWSAFQT